MCVCACVCVCVCVCVHVCVCVVCACACVCVRMCACMHGVPYVCSQECAWRPATHSPQSAHCHHVVSRNRTA